MDSWKKYVLDWSVSEQEEKIIEEQFRNIELLKIVFPEFWRYSYQNKNNFYQYVFLEAKQHVEKDICGKEWLEGDRCRKLWQRHCDFCMKSIETDSQEECYCSKDVKLWICADCYNAYKEYFGWTFKQIDDIETSKIQLK